MSGELPLPSSVHLHHTFADAKVPLDDEPCVIVWPELGQLLAGKPAVVDAVDHVVELLHFNADEHRNIASPHPHESHVTTVEECELVWSPLR